jgi:hypothetical protein
MAAPSGASRDWFLKERTLCTTMITAMPRTAPTPSQSKLEPSDGLKAIPCWLSNLTAAAGVVVTAAAGVVVTTAAGVVVTAGLVQQLASHCGLAMHAPLGFALALNPAGQPYAPDAVSNVPSLFIVVVWQVPPGATTQQFALQSSGVLHDWAAPAPALGVTPFGQAYLAFALSSVPAEVTLLAAQFPVASLTTQQFLLHKLTVLHAPVAPALNVVVPAQTYCAWVPKVPALVILLAVQIPAGSPASQQFVAHSATVLQDLAGAGAFKTVVVEQGYGFRAPKTPAAFIMEAPHFPLGSPAWQQFVLHSAAVLHAKLGTGDFMTVYAVQGYATLAPKTPAAFTFDNAHFPAGSPLSQQFLLQSATVVHAAFGAGFFKTVVAVQA